MKLYIILFALLLGGCSVREWQGIGASVVADDTRPRVECRFPTRWSATMICTTVNSAP